MPNKFDQQHLKNVDKYSKQIDDLYATAIDEVAKLLAVHDVDSLAEQKIRAAATKFFNSFNRNLGGTIRNGMKEEWKLANNKGDALVKQVVGNNPDKRYLQGNEEALQSFIGRQRDGLKLSDRVWNLTKEFKDKLEEGLKSGIGTGTGAKLQANDLLQYLNQQQGTSPGTGVYKDPRANARRLTRTETNMAYHEADWERWQQMDFVIGYEVEVSNNGHHCPLCLQLQGKYPKWFKFRSWHPQCYSDDTEVYTNHGWKLFADVTMADQILSLNPDTKNVEWAGIVEQVKYFHVGDMVRFHNRSLDMLVTPDHPMKYLTGRGQWMEKPASEFARGTLYRSSEYQGESPEYFQIGSKQIPFALFCQFMGYYLADGSIAQKKKSQVHIAQRPDNDTVNWAIMGDILHELPYKVCQVESGFYIFDQELHDYLTQFGKAPDKFIPDVIKNASKEHIQLFLDAFLSCDGHVRQPKSFIGSRGNVFTGKNPEKQYYSTSKQLAGDIGELILKIGKRPSFYIDKIKGKQQEFKNGTYAINSDMVRINELNSQTATVFNKDLIHYHGNVYDLELDRNHLMYVRRNGKCVWGSNCMCHATAILADDIDAPESDPNVVNQVPAGFAKWVKDNEERSKGRPQPYFVRDNFKGGKLTGGLLKPESMPEVKVAHLAMKTSYTTGTEISDTLREINKDKKWFVRGVGPIRVETLPRANGSTDMNGEIRLKTDRLQYVKDAMGKMGRNEADNITKNEADAMATLWHEITHNRNIPGNMRTTRLQARYMELANEYVARKTLPEFYSSMGVDNMPFPEFMNNRDSTGYNIMVNNFDFVVGKLGLDRDKTLESLKKGLFEGKYTDQKKTLIKALADGGIKAKNKDIGNIVALCEKSYYTKNVENLLKSLNLL